VGSAGQAEINVRFNTLLRMGDHLQLQKYVVKNVAKARGKTHVHAQRCSRRTGPDARAPVATKAATT